MMKVCKFLNYHNYYDLARYEEKIVENPYLKYVTHDFGWQLLIIFELLLNNYSSDLRPSPLSFIIMIIKIIKNFAHHCRWACVEPITISLHIGRFRYVAAHTTVS